MDGYFVEVLQTGKPHPLLGAHAETYGRVMGSWVGEIHNHMVEGTAPVTSIEAHFAWVLDGRAVQDVWITPSRKDRGATGTQALLDWYGATLRVFNPKTESWHVIWIDPVSGLKIELEGRRQGNDIVQIGTRGDRPIRWTFSEIQQNSFTWRGHILEPDGVTWRLEVEIYFRRLRS